MTTRITVADELIDCLKDKIPHISSIKVDRVCLGLGFTGVQLATGHVGLCHSLQSEASLRCCQVMDRAGTLAGSTAIKLAEFIKSWDMGERIVGTATINALSQIVLTDLPHGYSISEGNIVDHIGIRKNDTVALIGNIPPIATSVKTRAGKLYIFERGGVIDEGILPDVAVEEFLPRATVAIITGTTIANSTIDRVLELSKNARYIALVGPSASSVPDPFFDRGVSAIAGVIVVDSKKAMQVIEEGGGTPQLKTATKFVIIRPAGKEIR
jgi:uncharacterized protein (DUF4213/DUF364 family)